ncbi:MAG TPA: ATP-binding cassette domain-containing protein [Terriglobales bacterium]|nr:ATP-binding cassette domain-containing protein [Terriglobales bacterium]
MTLPDTSAEAQAPAVQFDNVHLGFDEGEVLRGLSFNVKPRDTLILLGETGTGKTLSLKIAAGLLRPTAGHATVLGKNLEGMEEKELLGFRREIGFVFQEGALFDSMTVADNVAYRLREEHLDEDQIEPRVQEALRFVELENTLELLPSELSGGMRRRVSIARALINRPPIVLYDSPTAGLDPVTSQTIITLILRLRDIYGVTSILATHRLQDGFAMANFRFDAAERRVVSESAVTPDKAIPSVTRFAVLREGVVYFEGEPEELAETRDPYLQRFLI